MAERVFRIFSLTLLTVGVVTGIAMADKNEPSMGQTKDLVYLVKDLEEAHDINTQRTVPLYLVQETPKKEVTEAKGRGLPTELPAKRR